MMPRISIFSSNQDDLANTLRLFKKEGYMVDSYSKVNQKTMNSVYRNNPDIILLDLEIENSDGIELCYQLKREGAINAYIVLYTEHEEEYIQVEAFKYGADDYIVKPINQRLLIKRIEALLNRKPTNNTSDKAKIITYKDIKIDRERYLVIKGDQKIKLPRKEFEMLYLFINHPQKVFSREDIYKQVWESQLSTNARIIDVHIRKIREHVGQSIIRTIKGIGYQLF